MSIISYDLLAQGDGSYIKAWCTYDIIQSNNNSKNKVRKFYVDFELMDVQYVDEEGVGWELYPAKDAITTTVRQELTHDQDINHDNRRRIRSVLKSFGIQEENFQEQVITSLEAEFTGTGFQDKLRRNPGYIRQGSVVLLVHLTLARLTSSEGWEVAEEELVRVNNEGRLIKDGVKIDCPICFEELSVDGDDYVVELPNCDHVFHQSCIKTWFVESQACPLCRSTSLPQTWD